MVAVAIACAFASMPAGAATSPIVVTFDVSTSTTIDTTACQSATPATQLGSVGAGTFGQAGANCVVTFGSPNGDAALHAYQSDAGGTAMSGPSVTALDTDGFASPTGKYVVSTSTNYDQGEALAVQGDGKILVAGWRNDNGGATQEAVLRRLNVDGTLDTTFSSGDGTDGYATFDPGAGTIARWQAVHVQPDGKIVVAGQGDYGGARGGMVARYTSTGALDTGNFNGALGYRLFKYNATHYTEIYDMALLADGSIAVAGTADNGGYRMYVTKFDSAGNFAPGWTQNGYHMPSPAYSAAYAIAVRPDGKLVLGGDRGPSSARDVTDFVVVQLNADGTLDTSFGSGGSRSADMGGLGERIHDLLVHPDGRVTFVGQDCENTNCQGGSPPYRTFGGRLTAGGDFDPTFSAPTGYRQYAPTAGGHLPYAVALDHDGKVIIAGHGWQTNEEAWIGRIDADGSPDPTWGTSGFQQYDIGGLGQSVRDVILDLQGRIVFSGNQGSGSDYDLTVWALDNAGIPDYESGLNDFDDGSGFFGACLRTTANPDFTPSWNVDATCAQVDAGGWNGIPRWHDVSGTKVGDAAFGVDDSQVTLRFGSRVPLTQQLGSYTAPITFEVRAP
jgi:uncharacterized delta-60 repeat protein